MSSKSKIAQRQFDTDVAAATTIPQTPKSNNSENGEEKTGEGAQGTGGKKQGPGEKTGTDNPSPISSGAVLPKRFYGSIKLDALRLRRDAGQIADEIIQHFASLVDAEVKITLEVQASIPNGVPDNVVRTVTENCRVLKFTTQEFEDE